MRNYLKELHVDKKNEKYNVELKWINTFYGPNPYADAAVVVARLSVEPRMVSAQIGQACSDLWTESEILRGVNEIQSFDFGEDALLEMAHGAAVWSKAVLNEIRGFVQHAGAKRVGPDVYIWIGFHHASLSRVTLQLALMILVRRFKGDQVSAVLKSELKKIWQACRIHHPDYQARILMVGAREMGVPYFQFMPRSKYWQFGWGINSSVFMETATNADGALGWQWQRNKVTSKEMMRLLGIPTPQHALAQTKAECMDAANMLGLPCVVKPIDNGGGKGVTANINDSTHLAYAFEEARRFSDGPLIIEQHVPGKDYRLMVLDGKLVAAIERLPSFVTGDGVSTIESLLNKLNATRSENLVKSHYLRNIPNDSVLEQHLSRQGVGLQSVLHKGKQVSLRSNANRSTGGTCKDVTHLVHPQVRTMAEQLSVVMGLRASGVDYLTRDITVSPRDSGGNFIEINATPDMPVLISAGWKESSVARLVLGEGLGAIPVTLNVVHQERITQKLIDLQNQHLKEGQAWVCGPIWRVGESIFHVKEPQPWSAVYAALRTKKVQELSIFSTVQEIQSSGAPLDHFSEIDIEDVDLTTEWLNVLNGLTIKSILK